MTVPSAVSLALGAALVTVVDCGGSSVIGVASCRAVSPLARTSWCDALPSRTPSSTMNAVDLGPGLSVVGIDCLHGLGA